MAESIRRVALTGAAGYIGSRLLHRLERETAIEHILAIDVRPLSGHSSPRVEYRRHDVTVPMTDLLAEHRIDAVVHLAFVLRPDRDRAAIRRVNVGGALSLLEACAQAGVRHLVHLSSTTVYGAHPDNREMLPEDAPLPELSRIAVLGGGPLAIQLVFAAVVRGVAVQWGTRDPAALREGVPRLRDAFDAFVRRGVMSEDDALDRLADLRIGDSAAMTDGVEMIVHAARGQGDVPAPEGTPRVSALPGKVRQVGLRFAPPIHAARLIEVIVGPAAMPEQIVAARALAKALGILAGLSGRRVTAEHIETGAGPLW